MPTTAPSSTIDAVACGMKLLEALAEMETATLSEVTRRMQLTPNRTFRLINTFLALGYVERAGHKTYRLGPKILLLGHRGAKSAPLMRAATPQLTQLSQETGEAIFLGVRQGVQQITVASWAPVYGWQTATPTQPQLPLHTGSMGLCLLAYAPEDVVSTVLKSPRERFTETTITEEDELLVALKGIREAGYRVSTDEFSQGWLSISAPILDREGFATAAIAIGFSNQHLPQDRSDHYATLLRKAAASIAALLP